MGKILLTWLLKLLTSEATKTVIALGVNKLVEHNTNGITKDIATTMIDGIAKSKLNPVTDDIAKDIREVLK